MSKVSKPPVRQFSVNFPASLVEEIDTICTASYVTRTSWILRAAQEKLDKERTEREKRLQDKFKEE